MLPIMTPRCIMAIAEEPKTVPFRSSHAWHDEPMIRYLGTGVRRYDQRPIRCVTRPYWECEAVVAGRIAPMLARESLAPQARTMWIFAPGQPHGWIGASGEEAQVVVFHIETMPEPFPGLLADQGYLACTLHDADIIALSHWASEVARHIAQPSALTALCYQRLVADIGLLALRDLASGLPRPQPQASERVARAEQWFLDHLHLRPVLPDIAQAVGCSVAHLRRLFHGVQGCSPQQRLAALRHRRVCELLDEGQLGHRAIAEECGFADAACLARAFRAHCGASPSRWRRRGRLHQHREGG